MVTLNDGIVLLNDRNLQKGDRCVFCVLGLPGGGTTMTSRMLESAGIFMGENMPFNAEDPEFAKLLGQPSPSRAAFRDLLAARNRLHDRWGFKAPYRFHWDLLSEIEDARILVVFRDICAVTNRTTITSGVGTYDGLLANTNVLKGIVEFIAKSNKPQLLFSYEKAILDPKGISEAILRFSGCDTEEAAVKRLSKVVEPNEKTYVTAQDPKNRAIGCAIDLIDAGRIAGWVRRENSVPLTIQIEIDGIIVANGKADRARKDLAEVFGGDGRFAFDFAFDKSLAPKPREIVIRDTKSGEVISQRQLG